MTQRIVQILLLPLFVFALFTGYAYGIDYSIDVIPPAATTAFYQGLGMPLSIIRTMTVLTILIPHFVLIVLITFAFSYLSALVYQHHAVWVAVLAVIPVVMIRSTELFEPVSFERFSSLMSFVAIVFEIGSFVVLLCLGTWLHSRRKPLSSSTTTDQ